MTIGDHLSNKEGKGSSGCKDPLIEFTYLLLNILSYSIFLVSFLGTITGEFYGLVDFLHVEPLAASFTSCSRSWTTSLVVGHYSCHADWFDNHLGARLWVCFQWPLL